MQPDDRLLDHPGARVGRRTRRTKRSRSGLTVPPARGWIRRQPHPGKPWRPDHSGGLQSLGRSEVHGQGPRLRFGGGGGDRHASGLVASREGRVRGTHGARARRQRHRRHETLHRTPLRMTRGPTKAVLTWLSGGTATVRVEKVRPAQAGLRGARSKRSAPATAESGQREVAGVGQLALRKADSSAAPVAAIKLGRRTVELGGPFLTGFDQIRSSTASAGIPRCCGTGWSRSPSRRRPCAPPCRP